VKYIPALDGLRAVAVIAVLLFHAEFSFASGGFLGVSLFFTLSGFLITTLLLAEFQSTGTLSLRQFYARRARRLLPAAYACLLVVSASAVWWTADQQRALGGDVVAAVANVANWRFAFSSTSYEELFLGQPSPVAHFWSLAIEEQIYLALPIVVVIALRRGKRCLAILTAFLLAASLAATLMTSDRNLVYNGTHTRAAELIVGMALAQLMFERRSVAPRAGPVLQASALAASAAFGVLVTAGSLDQAWIYRGGLVGVAALSALIISSVVSGRFPTAPLEWPPLVAIGKVSYGIYLFHWPVFLFLDEARTGTNGVVLFALRLAVTAVLTVASYALIEQPVRSGLLARRNMGVASALGLAAAGLVAGGLLITGPTLTPTEELLASGDQSVIDFRPPAATDAAASTSLPLPTLPPDETVLVIGTERSALDALGSAGILTIDGLRPQCPISSTTIPGCQPLDESFEQLVGQHRPHAIVVAVGGAEDVDADQRLSIVGAEWKATERAVVAVLDKIGELGLPVWFYYPSTQPASFSRYLDRLVLMRPWAGEVIRSGPALVDTVEEALSGAGPIRAVSAVAAPVRVMVIGDSTSINMAQALNDGGDGRLEVLWAGGNGCPIVAIEGFRLSSDAEWQDPECEPYAEKLPLLIERFVPDVVLLVLGPTELSEQRFGGDTVAHVAGTPDFATARDEAMKELLGVLDPRIPLLVADSPPVLEGVFVSSEMADPVRLDAINAQTAAWDERWDRVAVFAYREPLQAAERDNGSIRTDGVHPDVGPLTDLARAIFVDQLIEQAAQLRAVLTP